MIYRLLTMGLVLSWGAVQAADNSASAARAFCDSGKLAKGAEIAVFRGCLGCHTVDSKRIGPSYQEIAKKYPTRRTWWPSWRRKSATGAKATGANSPCRPTR